MNRGSWRRRGLLLTTALAIVVAGGIGLEYRAFMRPPRDRLPLDGTYPELPPGPEAHYINLPLDHWQPEAGEYRGFYLLSPGFSPAEPVVFFLTDGQMELVGTEPDFTWFDAVLGGVSYVLIGRRGHSPTLFPEVYDSDARVDYREAMRLYGSWQHVEDIERVRLDMLSKGLLTPGGKIAVFGASGAGFLVQQYLSRYGSHVSRALIESSGAPDLARRAGQPFIRNFADFNPEAAEALAPVLEEGEIDRASLAYLLFQSARGGSSPRREQLEIVERVLGGARAFEWGWVAPSRNFKLAEIMLRAPAAEASKVRMFELMAGDLAEYAPSTDDFHLVYAWAIEVLADQIAAVQAGRIPTPRFDIDRESFDGEILVVAGTRDVVFTVEIAKAIVAEYPRADLVVFETAHRVTPEDDPDRRALRLAYFRQGLAAQEVAAAAQ